MNFFYNIKKYLYCRFFHRKDLCYPEVWDRGLDGPWHCGKCHPCGEGLMEMLESLGSRDEFSQKMQVKTIDKVD